MQVNYGIVVCGHPTRLLFFLKCRGKVKSKMSLTFAKFFIFPFRSSLYQTSNNSAFAVVAGSNISYFPFSLQNHLSLGQN